LGKKVVDANLAAVKVTAHMLIALAIAAVPLYIIYSLRQKPLTQHQRLKWLATAGVVIVLVQIVLGTQVREHIDEISRSLSYQQRNLWIERLGTVFIVHRSFSWLVALLSVLIFMNGYKLEAVQKESWLVALFAGASIALGVVMAYLNIPAFAQPLHLLTGTLLVLTLFHLRLRVK
jgi:cytochrome c oxidase assembly protein subunit 15